MNARTLLQLQKILLAPALIASGLILAGGPSRAGVRLSTELAGASLRSCAENHKDCVELKASSMRGSQLKLLYGFKTGVINLSKGGVTKTYAAIDGYWDGAGDLLVFATKDADVSVELKTLKVSEYPRKAGTQ